jgi:uncharacterized protein
MPHFRMLIDVHTHAFPDQLAPRALAALTVSSGEYLPQTNGTVAGLLTSMDEAGIECSLVASIATRPEQAAPILSWSKQIASPRIVPLGSVHPASQSWDSELRAIGRAGLVGIKLHAHYQGFVVDARAVYPLYEAISALGLFVLFHAGFDIAFPGDDRATPERLLRVHQQFPKLDMIAAHVGGWQLWDRVLSHLAGTSIYLDTSFAYQLTPGLLHHILRKHPSDRILFGSDSPWTSQARGVAFIQNLPLDAAVRDQILGQNAQRLIDSHRPTQQSNS